jgi:hypothetical protein
VRAHGAHGFFVHWVPAQSVSLFAERVTNIQSRGGRQMTAEDLRAEIARAQIPIYRLAAEVGLHPGRLGQMLRETLPMPGEIAERISGALSRLETPTG